jgi:hypothetical protein
MIVIAALPQESRSIMPHNERLHLTRRFAPRR